jgi:UDP-GlcNAc:undecaprenyl-phosphate/decaprenyl-phosphate GlcNAc-1-phosphate transferase
VGFLKYLFIAIGLLLIELIYFRIAEHYKIIDKPNERSSHKHPTTRGGGVIFIIAALLFSIVYGFAFPYLLAGVVLAGAVSLWDDIRGLPNWSRFLVHLIAGLLILYEVDLLYLSPPWLLLILVLMIGVINAYNFMDGINGITGFYSMAIIIPLLITERNPAVREFQIYSLIGLIVFLIFNARKYARCFAGDVGSVGISIIILFFLINRIYVTGNYNFIAFLLLYGVDAVLTIIQRLYQRENIFKAHRKHLFQVFCNEFHVPHLVMSAVYAGLQLCINLFVLSGSTSIFLSAGLILAAGVSYIIIKWKAYQILQGR